MNPAKNPFFWVRKYTNTEHLWLPGQIVWARLLNDWYPAVLIDPKDGWKGLFPPLPGQSYVFCLTSGTVSKVSETDIRDFCQTFQFFYKKLPTGGLCSNGIDHLPRNQIHVASCIRFVMRSVGIDTRDCKEKGSQEAISWGYKNLKGYEGVCVGTHKSKSLRLKFEKRMNVVKSQSLTAVPSSQKQSFNKDTNDQKQSSGNSRTTPLPGVSKSYKFHTTTNTIEANIKSVSSADQHISPKNEKATHKLHQLVIPLNRGWKRTISLRQRSHVKRSDVYYYPPEGGTQLRSMAQFFRYFQNNASKPSVSDLTSANFCFRGNVLTNHKNENLRNAGEK